MKEETTAVRVADKNAKSRTQDFRFKAEPEFKAEIAGDEVRITAEQRTECHTDLITPMTDVTTTKRTLENGYYAQGTNLVVAGVSLGVGLAALAQAGSSRCSVTSGGSSRACTPAELESRQDMMKGIGIAFSAATVIPLGLFVINALRARDTTDSSEAPPMSVSTASATCGRSPLKDLAVKVVFPGLPGDSENVISGKTNDAGLAVLNMQRARTKSDEGTVTVAFDSGPKSSPLSLRDTPMRQASDKDASERAWAAAKADEKAREDALLKQIGETLTRLERPNPSSSDEKATSFIQGYLESGQSIAQTREQRVAAKLPTTGLLDELTARWLALGVVFEKLVARKDDEAWATANSKCRNAVVLAGCEGINEYLRAFDPPRHGKEAKALLNSSRVQRLIEENNEREAASHARWQADYAARQKEDEQKSREERQKQDERRDRETRQDKCRSLCREAFRICNSAANNTGPASSRCHADEASCKSRCEL